MAHENELRKRFGELQQQLRSTPPEPPYVDDTDDDEESQQRWQQVLERLTPAARFALRGERKLRVSPGAEARARTAAAARLTLAAVAGGNLPGLAAHWLDAVARTELTSDHAVLDFWRRYVVPFLREAGPGRIPDASAGDAEVDAAACGVLADLLAGGGGGGQPARPEPASHARDFTTVNWYGTEYVFAKGNQARSMKALWEAWEGGGHGLSQEAIGEAVGSEAARFELRKVFRRRGRDGRTEMHPAWGTMIQPVAKGTYRLVPPPPPPPPPPPKTT